MTPITHIQARDIMKQAFIDLLAQDAYGTNEGGTCQYLTPEGRSCVMGLALRKTNPSLDLKDIAGPAYCLYSELSTSDQPWGNEALELAQAAQRVHDRCAGIRCGLDATNLQLIAEQLLAADYEDAKGDPKSPYCRSKLEAMQEINNILKELA